LGGYALVTTVDPYGESQTESINHEKRKKESGIIVE